VSPLRILLVSANFRPSVGGIERYVEILGAGLAARGHEVTVLACGTGDAPASETVDGLHVARVPASDVLRARLNVPYPLPEPVSLARRLRRLVAETDVVNVNDALYATSVAALLAARAARTPSVLTQHVGFVPQRRRTLDAAQRLAIRTLGRCSRLATRVVAYNPSVADWARRTWGLGEVAVVPPGVPDAPLVDREAVRQRYDLPSDRLVALFAGRDVAKKGLDVFLGARDPSYELVAVTDRRPSSIDGARAVPFLEPDAFRELLASADAFVLPSAGEGFPLALQEALVSGVPCLVTHGPGYEHYLRDGEVVFVERDSAAIRTALKRLAGDERLRGELAERAREAGRREFGVDRFVEAYESVYSTLIREAPATPAGTVG
jgi:D-inositol-3-phosphate glycosyltransferase